MSFRTSDHLNVPEWEQALGLYHQAFDRACRKPDHIITGMFDKRLSFLHTENGDGGVTAMAVSGIVPQGGILLIDYLAVREDLRGGGIGRKFVRDIAKWAKEEKKLRGVIIEAEAEPGSENKQRMRFWESCGFVATAYVHKYIWVPETYRAMYLPLDPDFRVKDDGESLFRHIEWFHEKSYRILPLLQAGGGMCVKRQS